MLILGGGVNVLWGKVVAVAVEDIFTKWVKGMFDNRMGLEWVAW